jgi:hypothetical protein
MKSQKIEPELFSVITTIQAPTPSVSGLCRTLRRVSGRLLVIGDRKGPSEYPLAGTELFTIEQQVSLPLRLPRLLPLDHYTRKNIGYLVAISRRASCVYETDDDNRPLPSWAVRKQTVSSRAVSSSHWCNVYRFFSKELIWPRGIPLDQIRGPGNKVPPLGRLASVFSPIQQGLVDGSPDVDAIWRLVLDKPFRFHSAASVSLMAGVWCPFNSQSTWWWPEVYPLLYLPSFCTFRMTDIWRSFVAQRCLWELGGVVTFHAPEVLQRRNPHNLLKDFEDEVPGYLGNEGIVRLLEKLPLKPGKGAVGSNLYRCYSALIEKNIISPKELPLLEAWLHDVEKVSEGMQL